MRKKWPACSSSRVALTAVIVAVSIYINVNLNYADDNSSRFVNEQSNNLNHSEGLIETIQCDTVDYLPVGWCLDIDLIPRYIDDNVTFITASEESYKSFELKRYTIKGMEQCLSNKTIVFIGDSRTRYQYMHLGLSLKIGRFMSCPDIPKGTTFRDLEYDFEYDIECLGIASQKSNYQSWEGEGGIQNVTTWNDVFKHSTEMLRSSSSNHSTTGTQDSICDCYRPIKKFDPDNFYENRYTKRTTKEFGEINLIHLENLQDRVSMNEDYPPYQPFYSTSTKRCKPGECGRGGHGNNNNKWVGDLNASLYDIVPCSMQHIYLSIQAGIGKETYLACYMNLQIIIVTSRLHI